MPEPGPNLMWHQQGMMGFRRTVTPTYMQREAQALATNFLPAYMPGATAREGQAYFGDYTFDCRHDRILGMLSVNAFTGEIWPHSWHRVLGGHD